ncbi:HK97 gp10 family phage protein [Candidatus Bathyarchaeota archaeon]|nr:HK97 gp10 family phage protein [Candidatus Bathyarchaeota archaeon]
MVTCPFTVVRMSLTVDVDLTNFKKWIGDTCRTFEQIDKVIFDTAQIVVGRMRGLAPVRTGMLKASITIQREGGKVSVGPTAPYAIYVVSGTRPSPGRYVPSIGRRLVDSKHPSFGMHPGIAPNPFVERTFRDVSQQVIDKVDGIIRGMIEP